MAAQVQKIRPPTALVVLRTIYLDVFTVVFVAVVLVTSTASNSTKKFNAVAQRFLCMCNLLQVMRPGQLQDRVFDFLVPPHELSPISVQVPPIRLLSSSGGLFLEKPFYRGSCVVWRTACIGVSVTLKFVVSCMFL